MSEREYHNEDSTVWLGTNTLENISTKEDVRSDVFSQSSYYSTSIFRHKLLF